MSQDDLQDYFSSIDDEVDEIREIAEKARANGGDPQPHIEPEFAEDMAERCEKLVGIDGLTERIRELEDRDDIDREEAGLQLAKEIAEGKIGGFDDKQTKVDKAIRTAVALLTEGVVAAPIEGISEVNLETGDQGQEFIRVKYAGPIRSAGGTGQALSVLVADYVRQIMDIAKYHPRDDEIERSVAELKLYDEDTGLQYMPSDKEIRTIVKNVPIMLDAESADTREVNAYRDLERISGNVARGGMCLTIGEGIAQKAPKLQKYTTTIDIDGWDWLSELKLGVDMNDNNDDKDEEDDQTDENEEEKAKKEALKPSAKFLDGLIGGRPVFSHPSREGGFRLRYGRARNTGLAASGINPASMVVLNSYIATGTQLKTERPGKAQGMVPVDGIQGPTVRLNNGTVTRIDNVERARELTNENAIEEILDVGEMLVNYGEFLENNHRLVPASYVHEWWVQELEQAGLEPVKQENINFQQAKAFAEKHDIPLHPKYTYLWHDLETDEYEQLAQEVVETTRNDDGTMTLSSDVTPHLETLLVHHEQNDNTITIEEQTADALDYQLDPNTDGDTTLERVQNATGVTVRKRAPVRIGARMGRPEKSKRREKPKFHGLIPIGQEGGNERLINEAARSAADRSENLDGETGHDHDHDGDLTAGTINESIARRWCKNCEHITWRNKCNTCGNRTESTQYCSDCDVEAEDKTCPSCGKDLKRWSNREFDISNAFQQALNTLNLTRDEVGKVKGVQGLESETKVVEPFEKALLRAKHDILSFSDGTVRYDISDLPMTAFKPAEIDTEVDTLRELGYDEDINGNELTNDDQLVELKVQDVVIHEDAGDYMLRTANFVDDLLQDYYNMDPYYNADTRHDLVGELLVGLAPHTSAGVVGRLVGFTEAQAGYAHPFYHAAKRRNCFHPDTELDIEINGQWQRTTIQNLVEQHLDPNKNGYDDTYDDGSQVHTIAEHPDIDTLRVPSMNDDEQRTIEHVTHLSKHPAPNHMVELELSNGETLTVTPDHTIPLATEDGPDKHAAHEIKAGDKLYDYGRDTLDTVEQYDDIDLLEHIIQNDAIDTSNVMIRGMGKDAMYDAFDTALKDDWDDGTYYTLKSTASVLDCVKDKKKLGNYVYRDSIPVAAFQELYDDAEIPDLVPNSVTLGMNSDNTEVPRIITLDEELATLIGYYTAEGFTRKRADQRVDGAHDGSNHTDFAATEEEAREFIERTLERKFNVENPYSNESRITASGNLVRFFFNEVLDSGRLASKKEVPAVIKEADRTIKGAYVSGYISGDGSLKTSDGRIPKFESTTVSETLHENLQELYTDLNYTFETRTIDPRPLVEAFPDFYTVEDGLSEEGYRIRLSAQDTQDFIREFGVQLTRKQGEYDKREETVTVKEVSHVEPEVEEIYNLTTTNGRLEILLSVIEQCDGDEDSFMLLLEGLIDYSEEFLNHNRQGWSMDRPIAVTTRIDPTEIDDEAHNVDVVGEYPLEFYEATLDVVGPKEVDMEIAEDSIHGDFTGYEHTMSTSSVHAGPPMSGYKTVGDMDDKIDAQFDLAERARAIDETDVAERLINNHYLPDIRGNLRAFTQQDFRCYNCGTTYRRIPLAGNCRECGNDLLLNLHEGSVDKYVEPALEMAETYDVDPYIRQSIEVLADEIEQVFEDQTSRQTGLGEFV